MRFLRMDADEIQRIGKRLYGEKWIAPMAAALGVDRSTVQRWQSGVLPVPNPAAAALRCFLRQKK